MNDFDKTYHDALVEVLEKGVQKGDRTGTGTISRFGMQMRFDLTRGFPLITTKHVPLRLIIEELTWFLRGETNCNSLKDKNVHIWDEWADEGGELGPIYGKQWRSWSNLVVEKTEIMVGSDHSAEEDIYEEVDKVTDDPIDQIVKVIETLKTNPDCRRMIVSAWNVTDIDKMNLPPCHLLFQFYVADNKLSCQMYQRSCDMFLGGPFNLASYSALTHMLAHICDLEVGEFIWTIGDAHAYSNHLEQVNEQLGRTPYDAPILRIAPNAPKDIDGGWTFDHFILDDYQHHPRISAPVAV